MNYVFRISAYVWTLSWRTVQWKITLLFQLCSLKQNLIQGRVNFQVITLWKYLDFIVFRNVFQYNRKPYGLPDRPIKSFLTIAYVFQMCDYHSYLKENYFCQLACLKKLSMILWLPPKSSSVLNILFVTYSLEKYYLINYFS